MLLSSGPVSFADAVLDTGTPAPGSGNYRLLPDGGIAAAIETKPLGAFDPRKGQNCISRGDILTRLQYNDFIGLATTVNTAYPYVVSDTCQTGRYRVLFQACAIAKIYSTNFSPMLFIIPPGFNLPTRTDGTDPFFLGYSGINNRNMGPPKAGLRVDSYPSASASQLATIGIDVPLLLPGSFVMIPPGYTLLALANPVATAPAIGAVIQLRIQFAEFALNEDFNLL